MIITKTEVKTINRITVSTYDDQIDSIIPLASIRAVDYTKNPFHIPGQYVEEFTISFIAATKKILNGSGNFISEDFGSVVRFQAGLFIHVQNSILNDGFFKIKSAAAGELVVSDDDILYDEDEGSLIKINLVKFSDGFKLSLAKFIYHLIYMQSPGITSESIGDYSYSKSSEEDVLKNLFKGYNKIGVV